MLAFSQNKKRRMHDLRMGLCAEGLQIEKVN